MRVGFLSLAGVVGGDLSVCWLKDGSIVLGSESSEGCSMDGFGEDCMFVFVFCCVEFVVLYVCFVEDFVFVSFVLLFLFVFDGFGED